jgi:hypothetical protein
MAFCFFLVDPFGERDFFSNEKGMWIWVSLGWLIRYVQIDELDPGTVYKSSDDRNAHGTTARTAEPHLLLLAPRNQRNHLPDRTGRLQQS